MCAKFWFASILCAEVIAYYLLKKGENEENWKEEKRKKGMVAPLAFILATLEMAFG